MAVIDVTTYNGEKELFEIRYNILKDFVDEFRVIEFDKTFSGKPKEKKFNQHWDKVKQYFVSEDVWGKYWEEAKKSPNTNYGEGAKHWIREWCMKESIKECLTDLDDENIVMVGDVDEIWNPKNVGERLIKDLEKFKVFKRGNWVYVYYLNNRSLNTEWWGTLTAYYKHIKGECLNHLRTDWIIEKGKGHELIGGYAGWHFTSMGGHDKVKEKLTDSYTEETYASKQVLNNLEDSIKNNRDFLGRDFKYKIDESEWPEYLKNSKDKYKHLIK